MKILQLDKIFSSYWYSALLAVFCISLCVCSFQNFGPLLKSLRRSSSVAGRTDVSNLPFYDKIWLKSEAKNAGSEAVVQKVKDSLFRSMYRAKYTDEENGLYYFERGKIGRLGPLVTHASMIIILIGAIIVAQFGFKGYVNITVGDTVDAPGTDFQIRADDFKLELYPDGHTPKEYTSVLTIIENGVPQFTKTIEVNHPLEYKGMKFYQSSYGQTGGVERIHDIEVEIAKKAPDKDEYEVIGKYNVHIGDLFEVPDTQLKIKVASFVPDFVIDKGAVRTRSMNPNNPAALIELYENGEQKNKEWSFLKHDMTPHSKPHDYSVKFAGMDSEEQKYYTGLQVASHPGLFVIWLGCFVMLFGMGLSFYVPFKRVWVRVSDDSVEMGGRSYKNRVGFEKEHKRLKAMFG